MSTTWGYQITNWGLMSNWGSGMSESGQQSQKKMPNFKLGKVSPIGDMLQVQSSPTPDPQLLTTSTQDHLALASGEAVGKFPTNYKQEGR